MCLPDAPGKESWSMAGQEGPGRWSRKWDSEFVSWCWWCHPSDVDVGLPTPHEYYMMYRQKQWNSPSCKSTLNRHTSCLWRLGLPHYSSMFAVIFETDAGTCENILGDTIQCQQNFTTYRTALFLCYEMLLLVYSSFAVLFRSSLSTTTTAHVFIDLCFLNKAIITSTRHGLMGKLSHLCPQYPANHWGVGSGDPQTSVVITFEGGVWKSRVF